MNENNNSFNNTPDTNTSFNPENNAYQQYVEQKKTKREMFIGMNLINKIGVIFIIIGVIAFAQMPPEYVPDIVKTILSFALGCGMLLVGELMNRRKPDIFSHGITGGGTAVLYASIAVGYFTMHTINELLSFVLCFVLTAAVFFLADRYNSQTILALSIAGGFIPVFVLHDSPMYIYGAMVYLLILNSIAFVMSFRRKWTVTSFIVVFLNVIANILLIVFSVEINSIFSLSFELLVNPFALVGYIALSHLICAAVPVIATVRTKASITSKDIALVAINAVASTIGLIISFAACGWSDYSGTLFIALAAAYAGFAAITAVWFGDKSTLSKTLGGFAAAFALLFCTAQLEDSFVLIGLTVVSSVIVLTGIFTSNSFYRIFGTVTGILTLLVMFREVAVNDEFFWLSYLVYSVMLGVVVFAAIKQGFGDNGFVKCCKYIALMNIWIYSIYVILFKLSILAEQSGNIFATDYIVPCSAVVATFIAGFIYGKIKKDFFRILSMILYILAILFYFGLQLTATPAELNLDGTWYAVMLTLSIAMNVISVLVVYDLVKTFNTMTSGSGKLLPLIISGYMLISSTATLSAFDSATITNWILSVVYISMAFAWIWFGFRKNNVIMRRFGLGLALLASAKLFFIDLSTYSDVFGTISWFAFGIVLIAISYLYKLFGKMMTERAEESIEANKENVNKQS